MAPTAANQVLRSTGANALQFGSLVATDIPSLDASKITSGTFAIARGGTNSTATPTAGAVAYGTGSAYAFSAAGTASQVLISGGTGSPTWSNIASLLTSGTNISISGTTNATIATVNNPTFSTSVSTPILTSSGAIAIKPGANSTTAIQLQNVAGTAVLNVDTTNARVGIGSTAPAYALDINGTAGFQTAIYGNAKAVAETGDTFLRINQSNQFGNGIWIGSSDFKMGGGTLRIGSQGGAGEVEISGTSGDATTRVAINGNANANSWFNTGGNVGIGTTSPAKKLHVIGDIQASGSIYGTYGGTIFATNVSAGAFGTNTGGGNYSFPNKVGIGTTSPATELDVLGTVKTQAFQLTTGAIANYVLTADASGNATWQPSLPGLPSATTGQTIYFNGTSWSASSNLYNNDSKVGIGTTSPQAKLHVNGAASGSYACSGVASACSNFSDQSSCTGQSGCSWTHTSGSCKGFYDQNTCESYDGCVWGGSYCNGTYDMYVCAGTPNQCSTFSTSATCTAQSGCSWILVNDPAAIFMGSSVLVGTTTADSGISLKVAGDVTIGLSGTGNSYNVYAVAGAQSGTYKLVRYSSSLRYKKDIGDFDLGLDAVLKMHPVEFTWKSTGERDFGFIAEETEKVSPTLITYLDGKPEAVKYTQYVAVLTNAIKEQQKQIEALSDRVKAYGTENNSATMSSSEFNAMFKKAFNDLKSWLATQTLKVKELIADKISANTMRVKQIEMVDKATGEIYCTWIENGELMKKKGECK